jgi:hypothetical protein
MRWDRTQDRLSLWADEPEQRSAEERCLVLEVLHGQILSRLGQGLLREIQHRTGGLSQLQDF